MAILSQKCLITMMIWQNSLFVLFLFAPHQVTFSYTPPTSNWPRCMNVHSPHFFFRKRSPGVLLRSHWSCCNDSYTIDRECRCSKRTLDLGCHWRGRNLTLKELDALIDEMAIKYKDDKKIELDAAKEQLREKMGGAQSKLHGTTVSQCRSYASISLTVCLYHVALLSHMLSRRRSLLLRVVAFL